MLSWQPVPMNNRQKIKNKKKKREKHLEDLFLYKNKLVIIPLHYEVLGIKEHGDRCCCFLVIIIYIYIF